MQYLTKPVVYFEDSDFDSKGNFSQPNKPVFILLQSLKCYHCTNAKPAFQEFAERNPNILCGTIQIDSPQMTPEFLQKIDSSIYPNLVGFPSYIAYHNGKKTVYNGDRSVKSMEQFFSTLN
jgi:thiol-disulfide isomerase/thioredoxin